MLARFLFLLQTIDMLPPQLLYLCLKQFKKNLIKNYQSILIDHQSRHDRRQLKSQPELSEMFFIDDEQSEACEMIESGFDKLLSNCKENSLLISTATVYEVILNYYLVQSERNPVLYKKIREFMTVCKPCY